MSYELLSQSLLSNQLSIALSTTTKMSIIPTNTRDVAADTISEIVLLKRCQLGRFFVANLLLWQEMEYL